MVIVQYFSLNLIHFIGFLFELFYHSFNLLILIQVTIMKMYKYLLLPILFFFFSSFAQEPKNQWKKSMDAFEVLNGESPQQGGVLFTGSSSIRFWKNPAKDFNNPKILNRGFGGSQIIDLIENFDQIILQYHPKIRQFESRQKMLTLNCKL